MKVSNRNKKIFIILSTYIILLTSLKTRANENEIKFNEDYKSEKTVPFATYNNWEIYIGNKRYIERIRDDNTSNIYIIDDRSNKDPNMIICNSFKIKTEKEMIDILKIILEYENIYPSNWDRTLKTMKREWIIHNLCHLLNIQIESAENVDLNNLDEEKYNNCINIINEICDKLCMNESETNNTPNSYTKYKRIK